MGALSWAGPEVGKAEGEARKLFAALDSSHGWLKAALAAAHPSLLSGVGDARALGEMEGAIAAAESAGVLGEDPLLVAARTAAATLAEREGGGGVEGEGMEEVGGEGGAGGGTRAGGGEAAEGGGGGGGVGGGGTLPSQSSARHLEREWLDARSFVDGGERSRRSGGQLAVQIGSLVGQLARVHSIVWEKGMAVISVLNQLRAQGPEAVGAG